MAENPSILVIGPRWVGDMVMAQCLFSALREVHDGAGIDVLAPAFLSPLVRRMPQVNRFIDDPFPRGRIAFFGRRRAGRLLSGTYSHAYVMQGNWKSALIPYFAGINRRTGYLKEMRHGLLNDILPLPQEIKRRTARMYFNMAGGGTFRNPQLGVDAANQARLFEAFGLAGRAYVALTPGAEFGPAKRWPPAHYAAFARDMTKRGFEVVLLGGPKDRDVTAGIAASAPGARDLAGKTELADAIDLLAGASLAVSNDSGLMHLAAAVGTPVLAVYGSTSPQNTPPLTDRSELMWLKLDCSPCHKRDCPLGHLDCLNTLEPAMVIAAADRLLAQEMPRP